jgi:hypothetical protein
MSKKNTFYITPFFKSHKAQFVVQAIIILIVLYNIISIVVSRHEIYINYDFSKKYNSLEQSYLSSQYMIKNPKGWIPDEMVNAYAGAKYIRGTSPILIAPDTPPLGRYLIGLSEVLFDNPNYITILSAVASLFFIFILSRQIIKNTTLSLIPACLFSFEALFKNQLIYTPLLDMIQLAFLLPTFIFFNKGLVKSNNRYFLIAGLFLGCFISVKFFATGLTVVAAMGLTLLYNKYFKKIIPLAFASALSVLVLLVSYMVEFVRSPHVLQFLGIQKWVFLYHKSQLILPFSIWPLLLLNKWFVWYGKDPIISDPQWSITWPILTILSIAAVFIYFLKRKKKNLSVEVLLIWISVYILFFSFGQITSRYFVILIPIFYIISVYAVIEAIKFIYPNTHTHENCS